MLFHWVCFLLLVCVSDIFHCSHYVLQLPPTTTTCSIFYCRRSHSRSRRLRHGAAAKGRPQQTLAVSWVLLLRKEKVDVLLSFCCYFWGLVVLAKMDTSSNSRSPSSLFGSNIRDDVSGFLLFFFFFFLSSSFRSLSKCEST